MQRVKCKCVEFVYLVAVTVDTHVHLRVRVRIRVGMNWVGGDDRPPRDPRSAEALGRLQAVRGGRNSVPRPLPILPSSRIERESSCRISPQFVFW
jgi:hypothetical protein